MNIGGGQERAIAQLPELIAGLAVEERILAQRLFQVVATEGEINPPTEMYPWIERTFGAVETVRRQRIIRVTNRWTFEGAIFNPLRARRPNAGSPTSGREGMPAALRERIEQTQGDDFCEPARNTPEDTFGRVTGRRTMTASNVAKADGWHGVVIFDRHDPLAIDEALVTDVLEVAGTWAERAQLADPQARHFFLLWNCLWRAGASLVHGHAQMTLSQVMAHAKVELTRTAAARYRAETGGDYFADLARVHRALGLALEVPEGERLAARDDDRDADMGDEEDAGGKIEVFASLTPVKEREVLLLAPTYDDGALQAAELNALAEPLARTLRVLLDDMGVQAFNVALYGPPLGQGDAPRGEAGDWAGFPLVGRVVDRGNPLSQTADIAALELFGSSVIANDPFEVARTLRAGVRRGSGG